MYKNYLSVKAGREYGKGLARRAFVAFIILVLAAAFVLMTGCGPAEEKEAVATKTVTDIRGRDVEVPENPQRVACLYATTAHMMAMLDVQDKIVAASNGLKSDELMKMKIEGIDDLSVPSQEGDINVEELVKIDADLIFVKMGQTDSKGVEEKLADVGIPYLVVDYYSREELRQCLEILGEIFDKEDKVEEYIDFMDKTEAMVADRIAGIAAEEKPIIYHSVNEAIRTDGKEGICPEIMDAAGVIDASVDKNLVADGNKQYTTIEEIYNWEPDGIIANESSVTEYILTDPKWAGLKAVKDKKVYTLPVGATRWCHPGSMEPHMATLAIANMFYPDRFSDFDMQGYIKDYYEKYFGLELDDATIDRIMQGKGMRKSNPADRK